MDDQDGAESDESLWENDVQVMSDVHLGCLPQASSCTTIFSIVRPDQAFAGCDNFTRKTWIAETNADTEKLENHDDVSGEAPGSRADVTYDASGDLILQRRPRSHRPSQSSLSEETVTIHHQLTTLLPVVGLQVWRAELLLADFLLDTMNTSPRFHNVNAIELGAGTGLAGIVMAKAAKRVFITDRGVDVLDNCIRNVLANASSYAHGDGAVEVKNLDWRQPWPPDVEDETRDDDSDAYFWSEKDVAEARSATVLLAADVVYSPELTQAFFEILDELMTFGAEKTLFLTLEKRYNFSLDELDVVANGYSQFRSYFRSRESDNPILQGYEGKFEGRQIPTEQVRQHIAEYEREKDLELWEITRCDCQSHGTEFR